MTSVEESSNLAPLPAPFPSRFGCCAAQPTTIQHWQLRDLVASSDNSSEVYCVNGEKVVLYDTITQESKTVQQLNYQPTSMTVAHGFLATGGTKSEVRARHLDRLSLRLLQRGGSLVAGTPALPVFAHAQLFLLFALLVSA